MFLTPLAILTSVSLKPWQAHCDIFKLALHELSSPHQLPGLQDADRMYILIHSADDVNMHS
jgi:hypothetical protein